MEQFDAIIAAVSWADGGALALFVLCVLGATAVIERDGAQRPSLARLMARHRERWMLLMSERDVRIMDAALLSTLHTGAGFFASASMIAIGGVAAIIGNADVLLDVANDLTVDDGTTSRAIWELKLLFLIVLLTMAFMKFVWAYRLFAYCAVMIGATPPPSGPEAERLDAVRQAAAINMRAGRSFNRGLRLIYFALASLAWLLGPLAFAIATLATAATLYRREFLSETRRALDPLGAENDRSVSAGEQG